MAEFILFSSYPILALIVGLVIGSFLNVVIYRLPLMMLAQYDEENEGAKPVNLWWPPSHCPQCEKPVLKRDNIPVISWLLLKEMPFLRQRHFRTISDHRSVGRVVVLCYGFLFSTSYQCD